MHRFGRKGVPPFPADEQELGFLRVQEHGGIPGETREYPRGAPIKSQRAGPEPAPEDEVPGTFHFDKESWVEPRDPLGPAHEAGQGFGGAPGGQFQGRQLHPDGNIVSAAPAEQR